MLTETIRLERFKAISRRYTEVIQIARLIQKTELSKRHGLYIWRQFPASPPGPDQLRFRIGEILDHLATITRRVIESKVRVVSRAGLQCAERLLLECRDVIPCVCPSTETSAA